MKNKMNQLKKLPIAFAQVRENSTLDLDLCQRLSNQHGFLNICMIASGGDTASHLLAAASINHLHLTDINPAQILLTKFKMGLLLNHSTDLRLKILGHLPYPPSKRRLFVEEFLHREKMPPDAMGPIDLLAEKGADYSGRYEGIFDCLHQLLKKGLLCSSTEIITMLSLLENRPILQEALNQVFNEESLAFLFGPEALQNKRLPFSTHFYEQTILAMSGKICAPTLNPFLNQFLTCSFNQASPYPWLQASAPTSMPSIHYQTAPMHKALTQLSDESLHLVHLSNILDWLSHSQAEALLNLCSHKLRRGGAVIIRQLNSTLSIKNLSQNISWDQSTGNAYSARDKSFFYRNIFVGFKK